VSAADRLACESGEYDRGVLTIVSDARCLEHRAPSGYPERPERLTDVLGRLRREAWRLRLNEARDEHAFTPSVRCRDAVLAVHTAEYVHRFERAVERGDALLDSADNPLSPGTALAAWAAVEATLSGTDCLLEPGGGQAFVAIRPPGHHAEKDLAMGFCFFNNIAVAAAHLRRGGLERVAIFDFDVHHGNGTQHLFYAQSDVFYASVHQYPFYPGTGAANETGVGAGTGATLNVPLPAGTGDEGYERAFHDQVLPALRQFAPDALLLSAGFDAWRQDPLGGMQVTEKGFASWGTWLRELADEVCAGRVLAVLEGGYDIGELPNLVVAHLHGLCGTA
jgi:acetoin utilization deacetylase AcuC-like enzyme